MSCKNGVFLLILVTFVFQSGCQKNEDEPVVEAKMIQMPEISKDFKLPTKLWDLVMGSDFEKSVKQSTNFVFAPIAVELRDKTSGVLSAPALRFEFPKAGGEIDFAKYIKGERGTFKISFDFAGFTEGEDLHIFYVSGARKRKLNDEIYGSGCSHFYDVKSYITAVNGKEGLVVNVTRERHDSAVGGHFIFSYKKDKQTFVSQVSFTDSKRPDLFCDANENKEVK